MSPSNGAEPAAITLTPDALEDFKRVREAQRDAGAQHADALSDEFAVEVEGVRGEKRIDHKKVPLRNADGTLNRAGKALLEIQAPADRAEQKIADKMRHGEYKEPPRTTAPRLAPLGERFEERVAKRHGLTLVTSPREAGGRALEVWGRRLYRDATGHYRRLVLHYGRVVEYSA